MKAIELYIHIPFCVKKCHYCDFLSGPAGKKEQYEYVKVLLEEIRSSRELLKDREVVSIFFGGGTPSILEADLIGQIMTAIKNTAFLSRNCEITIECNPGTVTNEKIKAYQTFGINRLSFGLQSTNNEELKLLGRIHTYEQFLENYHAAREAGFTNINIDLMSALPYQSINSYETTLRRVCELEPEHISAYSLIIEEGTDFYERFGENKPEEEALPTQECDRQMYALTKSVLKEYGYHRYEISNYAKKGKECLHNSGYWRRTDYLGFGLGASSLYENVRWHNVTDRNDYLLGEFWLRRQEEEVLTRTDQIEEFMFLGLRMCEGISQKEFKKQFGVEINEIYGTEIRRLMEEKVLCCSGDRYYLSEYGLDVSNAVFAEFIRE